MPRTGYAKLPLHSGKCPRWLFKRMVELSKGISEALILEFGTDEFLRRISNPFWFQALACTIGFDWHSSGTTTTTCGALKLALSPEEQGIAVAGGKGKASSKTPGEIEKAAEFFSLGTSDLNSLVKASRLSAKVDNSCVQDGYKLYHHCFFISENSKWAVVQQGMSEGVVGKPGLFGCTGSYARRYHWLSDKVASFVSEPHTGIASGRMENLVLDMTSKENESLRKASLEIIRDNPRHIEKYIKKSGFQKTLLEYEELALPEHHEILEIDIGRDGMQVLEKAYELQPKDYEELVSLRGMGPKKIRALALISALVYGENISWKDPAKYSFAHGGKDGFPYPVDRENYDHSIETLRSAVDNSKIGNSEKLSAIRRLNDFINRGSPPMLRN